MKISKTRLRLLARLRQKKNRDELGLFVAEGEKCVSDTLAHFPLRCIVASEEWINANRSLIAADAECFAASQAEMSRLSCLSTAPDVIAYYSRPTVDPEEWCVGIESRLTLLLDCVQDPGNLGTIIRVADWFGVHHIAASPDTVDYCNPKTIQATMGAISRVKMLYTDLAEIINRFPALKVYGTLLDGENIYTRRLSSAGFIVMGNEGKGISAPIRSLITDSLFIPSYPPGEETSESLNVSMATGITLSEFRRRLLVKD